MCGVEGSVMDLRDSKIDAGALSRGRSRSWPQVITRATAFAHDLDEVSRPARCRIETRRPRTTVRAP